MTRAELLELCKRLWPELDFHTDGQTRVSGVVMHYAVRLSAWPGGGSRDPSTKQWRDSVPPNTGGKIKPPAGLYGWVDSFLAGRSAAALCAGTLDEAGVQACLASLHAHVAAAHAAMGAKLHKCPACKGVGDVFTTSHPVDPVTGEVERTVSRHTCAECGGTGTWRAS